MLFVDSSARMVIMAGPEERGPLQAAAFRGDGREIVRLLKRRPWPVDTLQLIGDGLLIALGQDVEGAAPLAAECVDALQVRGWEGDEELAAMLQARSGTAPTPLLLPQAHRPRGPRHGSRRRPGVWRWPDRPTDR